jgi:outer membrane lipoprotein-sorting protein
MTTYQQPEELGMTRVIYNGSTAKVFKGWNKSPGSLTENMDIIAQWETSAINGNTTTIDPSTLNAADLYAISKLTTAKKKALLEPIITSSSNYPITIPMGHDFNFENITETTNLMGSNSKFVFDYTDNTRVKIYDGNHGIGNVRPL